MKIHFNQTEIEAALRDFVEKQGIRLRARTVKITFTATRTGAGLTAELEIDEVPNAAPDFTLEDDAPVPRTALAVVQPSCTGNNLGEQEQQVAEENVDTPPAAATPEPEAPEVPADGLEAGAPKPPKKTPSLFGQ